MNEYSIPLKFYVGHTAKTRQGTFITFGIQTFSKFFLKILKFSMVICVRRTPAIKIPNQRYNQNTPYDRFFDFFMRQCALSLT
jgi:hypothetical protein